MPSAADICNVALGILGVSPIMSLDQRVPEAEACARLYPFTRDAILSEFNWRFATREARLNPVDEEILGPWHYVYSYPMDCLGVQMVYDVTGMDREGVPFSVGFENRIYTNVGGAVARYRARVINEGIYPPHFVDVFAKRLAVELGGQLQNVGNRMDYAAQLYNIAATQAELIDAGLGKDRAERIPMMDARVWGFLPED